MAVSDEGAHQSALLGLGQLGGHKVLHRRQHCDDGRSDQGTDSQEVVEKDYPHNDLRTTQDTFTSMDRNATDFHTARHFVRNGILREMITGLKGE